MHAFLACLNSSPKELIFGGSSVT